MWQEAMVRSLPGVVEQSSYSFLRAMHLKRHQLYSLLCPPRTSCQMLLYAVNTTTTVVFSLNFFFSITVSKLTATENKRLKGGKQSETISALKCFFLWKAAPQVKRWKRGVTIAITESAFDFMEAGTQLTSTSPLFAAVFVQKYNRGHRNDTNRITSNKRVSI